MRIAPPCIDEQQRLDELRSYDILDTPAETGFDDITQLLAAQLDVPIVLVSLVDQHRQWFKSKVGLTVDETPRDLAFCAHALHQPDLLIIEDTHANPDFADNPLVTGEPYIRFYAGMPLVTAKGHALGTLCVIDHQPRQLSKLEQQTLRVLGKQVMQQLDARRQMHQLHTATQRLIQMNAEKEQFFSLVARDLRIPFSQLLTYTDQLNVDFETLSATERHHLLSRLHQTARQTFRSVDNLLQWAMLETNTLPFHPTLISIDRLITPICQMFAAVARSKGIDLKQDVHQGLRISADVDMMYALLQHLLSNAIQHTPAGGQVMIRALMQDDRVLICVADTGTGMSADKVQRLFRVDTEWHQHSQRGLGLLLCQQYMRKHQGQLIVESTPALGTTMTLSFKDASFHDQSA